MKLLREQPVFTPHPRTPTNHSRVASGPSTIFTPPDARFSSTFASNGSPTPAADVETIDATLVFQEQPETPVGIFEQFIYHLGPPLVS